MNANDLVVGVDFTGVINPNGGDFNNGVNLAVPTDEGNDAEGRGLLFTTTDTAANTPNVPDPTVVGLKRVKRFKWVRRPFAGETVKSAKNYTWNDDAVNVAVYLKWVEDSVDLTALTNLANSALATSNNAVAEAQVANDTANAANTNANTAIVTANAATVAATAANVLATTANAAAAASQLTANSALGIANGAVALNSTPFPIAQRLSPSATHHQEIRTSADATTVEWYDRKTNYIKLSETYGVGTDNPAAAVINQNTRITNTVDNNSGGYITHNQVTGISTINVAGTYRVKGWAIVNRSGASALSHQLVLVKIAAYTMLLSGSSNMLTNGNTNNNMATIEGLVTLNATDQISLDHWLSTATGVILGKAANINPFFASTGKEVYTVLELEYMGA